MRFISKSRFFAIVVIIFLTAILVLMWRSFRIREIPLEGVQILFTSQKGDTSLILMEFVEPNTLKVAMSGSSRFLSDNHERVAFDMSMLDDFFATDPKIETLFSFSQEGGFFIGKKTLELSDEQLSDIQRLLRNVARNRSDGEFVMVPGMAGNRRHVFAIIDGQSYWSLYFLYDNWNKLPRTTRRNLRPYFNWNLVFLSYELLDLSLPVCRTNWITGASPIE